MTLPPESTGLARLQACFAAALRVSGDGSPGLDPGLIAAIVDDGFAPAARLSLYRNNSRAMFTGALRRSFPVLERRVGEGYFHRLAAEYREAHPSRSGDLHWIGERFPTWLADRLAGTEYAWLADLARLEWACEEVLVAADPSVPALSIAELGGLGPETLAGLRFGLHPALRCVSSRFPIWSVWRANQPDGSGAAIAAETGAEHVVVTRSDDRPALHLRPQNEVRFIAALAEGRPLLAALEIADLPVGDLAAALSWLFQTGLVVAVEASEPGATA
jgi:hypothetical protein